MLKILQYRKLWLSNIQCLNDTHEIRWASDRLMAAFSKRIGSEPDRTKTPALIFFLQNLGLNLNTVMSSYYVTSFSKQGDCLSQWRGYSDDGRGYAIGFDPKAFRIGRTFPVTSAVMQDCLGLFKIEYGDAKLDEYIRSFVASVNEYTPDKVMEALVICSSFKNEAFKEEEEWRIGYTPLYRYNPSTRVLDSFAKTNDSSKGSCVDGPMKFRAGKYGITPYFEYGFQEDAVVELVCGPLCSSGWTETFLQSVGLGHVNVRRSTATYR